MTETEEVKPWIRGTTVWTSLWAGLRLPQAATGAITLLVSSFALDVSKPCCRTLELVLMVVGNYWNILRKRKWLNLCFKWSLIAVWTVDSGSMVGAKPASTRRILSCFIHWREDEGTTWGGGGSEFILSCRSPSIRTALSVPTLY